MLSSQGHVLQYWR